MERANATPMASQQKNHPGMPSSTETNNICNRIVTSDLTYYTKLRRYICHCCCLSERTADHSPSISRKHERSIHGPQLPQPSHRDSPMSISPEDDSCKNINNTLDIVDDNLIGNGSDLNHEIIGQQIVFSTDSSVEVTDDDDLQNMSTPSHRTPPPLAVMPLPLSMVYVKQSIRQYDKEEGSTFRRQQQLQATKSTTTTLSSSSRQQPPKSTRTYVNGIIVDDDLFFDAKTS